ncbi:MFS general substrate transporter [Athelia psychrophila]|uniref:MFS general substrate transporter n=1 Tax=Athelia psychrophila TaxID=1759441 RepID=A0A166V9S2_9AGAM|nr:MFS general substrate transporter [Fibularhizoctonia sp. CBS 109695]
MSRQASMGKPSAGMEPPPRRSERLDGEMNSYAMSPLADLHRAYLTAEDDAHSLFDQVNSYRGKTTLDKKDILDRGLDSNVPDRPRFSLKDTSFQRLSAVVSRMQTLMEAAAELMGPEERVYVIDPEKLMMPLLIANNSRFELDRAWNVVTTRLSNAHDKFSRYVNIRQGKTPLASPMSTSVSVMERLKQEDVDADRAFDIMYQGMPSLRAQLNEENLAAIQNGETLRSQMLSPLHLKDAFPDRYPEESPAEHYYGGEGARIINAPYNPDIHGVSTEVATLGLSLYVLGLALGPMTLAPLSEYYGRSPIYITSYFLFLLFTLGTALVQNLGGFLVLRILAGIFSSVTIANFGGTIADLWEPHDTGVWRYFLYSFVAEYEGLRKVFWAMLGIDGGFWVIMCFCLKETRHSVLLSRLAAQERKRTGDGRIGVPEGTKQRRPKELASVALTRPFRFLFTEAIVIAMAICNEYLNGLSFLFNTALCVSLSFVFRSLHGPDLPPACTAVSYELPIRMIPSFPRYAFAVYCSETFQDGLVQA